MGLLKSFLSRWSVHRGSWADDDPKPVWRSGRSRFHFKLPRYSGHKSLGIEWEFFRKPEIKAALTLLVGSQSDSDATLHIGFLNLFDIFISPTGVLPKVVRDLEPGRDFGVSVHGGMFWWSCWEPEGQWSKGQPWWWSFSIDPVDVLLGKEKGSTTRTPLGAVRVPLPEANYEATAEKVVSIYKRPRWFSRRRTWVSLDIPKGIPFPGKGTTGYNCGMDGLHGISGDTLAEAVGNAVAAVIRNRERYGGSRDWKPELATA